MNAPPVATTAGNKFLSLAEAAAEIGCTRRFLEGRIEDGELSVFKPSARMVRVARAELNRWIEAYTVRKCITAEHTTGKVSA